MAGGLRYEDARRLPERYQEQVAQKVLAQILAKLPPAEEKAREDPCLECLRWWEYNGVDEGCPYR